MTDKVLVSVALLDRVLDWLELNNASIEEIRLAKRIRKILAAPTPDLAALEKQAAIEWAKAALFGDEQTYGFGYAIEDGWYVKFDHPAITEDNEKDWTRACTILEANGMLERHDKNSEWVRIRESDDG